MGGPPRSFVRSWAAGKSGSPNKALHRARPKGGAPVNANSLGSGQLNRGSRTGVSESNDDRARRDRPVRDRWRREATLCKAWPSLLHYFCWDMVSQ